MTLSRWAVSLGSGMLAVLSGLLLSLSLPPEGWRPLALVSWLPLLGAQYLLPLRCQAHPARVPSAKGPSASVLAALVWAVFVLASWSRTVLLSSGSLTSLSWDHLLQAAVAGSLAFLTGKIPGDCKHLGWWGPLQIVGLEKLRSILFFPMWGPAWAVSLYTSPLLFPVGRWVGSSGMTLLLALPQFLIAHGLAAILGTPATPGESGTNEGQVRESGEEERSMPRRRRVPPGLPCAIGGFLLAAILATTPFWGPLSGRGPLSGTGGPPGLVAATVRPQWDYLSHPGLAAALRQGNPDRVADILTQEAEEAALRAAGEGAKLVAWPLDYLNFDPGRDHKRGPKLLALARSTGASLVIPYGYFTADGPVRGVAVIGPSGIKGKALAPGDLYPLTDEGNRSAFLPVPAPRPMLLSGEAGAEPWLRLARALRSLRPGWQEIAAAQVRLTVASGHRHPYPWGLALDAAQTGSALIYADWEQPVVPPPARGHGTTIQLHTLTLPPGPGPYARYGDLLGWAGVFSLLAGTVAGRRHRPIPTQGTTPPPSDNFSAGTVG